MTISHGRASRPVRRRLALAARKTKDRDAWRRLMCVLLCLEGASQHHVSAQLCMAQSTVSKCLVRHRVGGVESLLVDQRCDNGNRKVDETFRKGLRRIQLKSPEDFGWQRTTWTRELLAKQMANDGFPKISVATMGRTLSATSLANCAAVIHGLGASISSSTTTSFTTARSLAES